MEDEDNVVHAESPRDSAQGGHDNRGEAPSKLHEITNLVENTGERSKVADSEALKMEGN